MFAGSALTPIETVTNLSDLSRLSSTLLLLNPSRKLRTRLIQDGFTRLHSFVTIPSRKQPRWLLPAGNRRGMLTGTRVYEPHKWTARALKKVLTAMIKVGWNGTWCSKVLIASTTQLALETLVRTVTGEQRPAFALSLGRQAAVRKLTIQVMRPCGSVLGYIKLPLTPAAAEGVRNESRAVDRLSRFPALRRHIPRVLYSGDWNGSYILFQSPLEGQRGPVLLSQIHRDFLRRLWDAHSELRPGHLIIDGVAAKWQRARRVLGTQWEEIGEEVFRRSSRALQGKTVRCGIAHGDFAPWNTRVRDGHLLLFDWESADWSAPNAWDVFHFQVRSSYFLNKHKRWDELPNGDADESFFLLYGLRSACQLLDEENPEGIEIYKRLLMRVLEQRRVSLEDSVSTV
jgi:hypothetical protein